MPTAPAAHALVEREHELAALAVACRDAAAGRGMLVVVEGAAGIGKTALLEELRRSSAADVFDVLRASGAELERELAFGVVRQLFERRLRALPDDARAEMFGGAAALAAPVLLEPDPQPAPEAVHAALHGLYWLAAELAARGPLLLIVDDAQWADTASQRWLAYLGRRLDGLPLLLVVARRERQSVAGSAPLEGMRPQTGVGALTLEPLTETGVARCLTASYGGPAAPEFVDACWTATGGNPFLLRELANSLRHDGLGPDAAAAGAVKAIAPASIAQAVLVRLAPLGRDAVAVAEAVAVLSTDASLARVAALAAVPLERAADLADRLATAGVLGSGTRLQFLHPIMRSAVHDQMPIQRRGLAHLAAAELLLADGAGPERAASHLLHAPPGGRGWIVDTLRAAAAAASARGSPDVSVVLLRRAYAEAPSGSEETLLDLANAEFTVQDPIAVQRARDAMAAATTPAGRVQAGLAAARALTPLGRYDEAVDILEIVEGDAAVLDAPSRQAVRFESLMLTTWHRGVAGLAEPLIELGVDDLSGETPAERLLLALRVMERNVSVGPRAPMLALARRVLVQADPSDPADENAVLITSRCLGLADQLDSAIGMLSAVIDGGRSRGAVATVATALTMRAEARCRSGRLADAETDAREALAIAVEHGVAHNVPAAVAVLVEILLERESARSSFALLERYTPAAQPLPPGYVGHMLLFARGRAAAAAGDARAAVAQLEACGRERTAWGEHNPASGPWRSELALVLAALGRSEEAMRLADEELRLALRFGADRATGIAIRTRALLESGEGQLEGLREAARTLAGSPAKLEHARALLDLGAALRRNGHVSEARRVLAEALDGCQACGAHELAARARVELTIAGARPRRDRLTGPDALTAAERRVAELAAGGMTNRQIAQALFLTTKTVETHLSHIYPKLGIAGRGELKGTLFPT